MDRATRKANLKKLQLPGTGTKIQQCKTSQIAAKTATSTISSYFLTPEKSLNGKEQQDTPVSPMELVKNEPKTTSSKPKANRVKRTKLDAFILKTTQAVPKEIQTVPKLTNDDDFDIPEKKTKKAPPISNSHNSHAKGKKTSKRKKQTTIKSAFLRNEQLFAEIAAQHCAADNFNGDDIQLAIAISKSEAESKGVDVIDDINLVDDGVELTNDYQKAEKIRQKLEMYGFRTAESKDYNAFAAAFMPQAKVRRLKTKWANKFTALTLRDDQLQNQKLQQKIATIVNPYFPKKLPKATEQHFSNFLLQSALLRKCERETKRKIVNLSKNPQISNELYFVEELFEISKLPPGHLLKDWTAIQGRDLTPKKCEHNNYMESKLQRIYAELEEYFKSLKAFYVQNDSVNTKLQISDQVKEDDDKIVDNMKQIKNFANEIPSVKHDTIKSVDIFPKLISFTLGNNNGISEGEIVPGKLNEDSITITDMSLTSSICDKIRQILPPTKDIDLMQVSSSSLNVEHNIELPRKTSQANELDHIKTSEYTSHVKMSSNNINKSSVVSGSIITEASNCSNALADLMEISNYSLGVESFVHVKQKVGHAAPNNDIGPSKETHNSEDDFTQKDNLCDLNLMHVSSNSIVTQTVVSTTEKNRSNSPDLFADSDIEMEEDTTSAENIVAKKNNSSLNSFDGLTTYEIYSSDEVKNASSSVKPNLLTEFNQNDLNVIDLTQEDGKERTQNGLNQSKSILEVDIFADSPPQHEDDKVVDINSNTQQSEYLKNGHNETFQFSLSPYKTNVELPRKTMEQKSLKITLNMDDNDINAFLDEDDDDVVLRKIEQNQTNTSFLDFQGSKQLETCFHRETAIEHQTKVIETTYKKSLPGNDTIFRELYSKYLGGSATQNETTHKVNEPLLRNSFTQVFPTNETQFTMDFSMTVEQGLNNRKSLSFVYKTPEKIRDLNNCKLSKSQSFNEKNISIDLTQNEDDVHITAEEEEDDDCLVLSDDEINYSIWNANKTGRLHETDEAFGKEFCKEGKGSKRYVFPSNSSLLNSSSKETSLSTKCLLSQQSYSDFEAQYSKPKENHLYSHFMNEPSKELSSLIKELSPAQQICSNFNSRKPAEQNPQLERSSFGILEEFSQTVDFSPNMCTETKALEDTSFLDSPTENSAPMKIFSSCRKSVHQLNDLLFHLDNESPMHNNLDEYDEFDFQIDHNRSKKSTTTTLPRGLDQLLTAEISFDQSPYEKSPNKKNCSTDCNDMDDDYKTSFQKSSKLTYSAGSKEQELTVNNKTYTIRYVDTPKPDYTLYSEAELLKELYKCGIKPLKRKQAVKMLEYIYIQTHPIIADDLITENSKNDCQLLDNFGVASLSNSTSTYSLADKDIIQLSAINNLDTQSNIIPSNITTEEYSNNCDLGKKLNLDDASGKEMLRYSLDLQTELVDEQYILQTNVSKKTPQPLMPFHIAWFNLVCSNRHLHENILMYEPIDLQEIYIFLKGIGYRYDPKDLKQFFDRRCIIFRYDLAAAGGNNKANGNNRHVRKRKCVNNK